MGMVIGADHEFHDEQFAADWANRFIPTPERMELFNLILSELMAHIPSDGLVVELGIGPGYLAEHLLTAMPKVRYIGIDFSLPMLDIARDRLESFGDRIKYVQADLLKDSWWMATNGPVDGIVTTWALHDLGGQKNTSFVYKASAQLLREGGIFLNGDFIKPEKTRHEYEPGRFKIHIHLKLKR